MNPKKKKISKKNADELARRVDPAAELETLRRVDLLTQDVARGASEYELLKRIETFGLGADSAGLLRRVQEHLLSHSSSTRSDAARFGILVEAAMGIYRDARDDGDFKSALEAIKFVAGMNPPEDSVELLDADSQG